MNGIKLIAPCLFVCSLVGLCAYVADYVDGTKIKLHRLRMCVRKRRDAIALDAIVFV